MALDGFKRFFAQDVFNAAGVLGGSGGVHPQRNQPLGEEGVALVNAFCNFLTFFGEGNQPVGAHGDALLFPKVFHGHADTGFAKPHFRGNIHGTHRTVALF